jgi:type I restriction enzyme R subunit
VGSGTAAHLRYFCAKDSGDAEQLKANEPTRLALYKHVAAFTRAYANLANELTEAGYTDAEIETLKAETDHFEKVRHEVKLASGDYIDLKMYEPAMRHLIDTYIRAEESEKISAFDDMSLVQLIVERGAGAVDALPKGIRQNREAVAETIENNVRRLIIDEQPINPKYYERMSQLLDALIKERKQEALEYQKYLEKIVALTKQAVNPGAGAAYPKALDTSAKRALYDNLGKNEALALEVDNAIHASRQDDWRGHPLKIRRVKLAIKAVVENRMAAAGGRLGAPSEERLIETSPPYVLSAGDTLHALVDMLLELAKNQNEY